MNVRSSLLENVLDALDRLFDRKTSTVDIWALVHATVHALGSDPLASVFEATAECLLGLLQERLPAAAERERALDITNKLRISLAESLP